MRIFCTLCLMFCQFYVFSKDITVDQYKLGAGDEIKIVVFGHDEMLVNTKVPNNGIISYPFLGEIRVLGLSVSEFENMIYEGLNGDYFIKPSVAVTIEQYRPFFIDGEVKKPGGYPYQPGLSISKAAALAGGFTERANKESILIIRDGALRKESLAGKLEDTVLPGDIITIRQRFF